MLVNAARAVADQGHQISFVQTCGTGQYHNAVQSDFAHLAANFDAPFMLGGSVRTTMAAWRDTGTEVCISINWPTLVPAEALEMLPHGILNAHAGDLPRYRGNACPNWAILNHEQQIGLTIHRMVPALDAGPWLFKTFMPLDEDVYIGDVYAWLERTVPRAFCEAIDRLKTTGFRDQNSDIMPLRTFPRRPEDARIDWKMCSRDILALIRASSHPFDGAFTTLDQKRTVRIWRARTFSPPYDLLAVPGQVCMGQSGDPVIATADGMILLEECNIDGEALANAKHIILRSLRNRLV
ncbi:methionyl-tRNA formyltransferase [Paracoccus liaowanqingii]|nr:formyltransferase family protein [Paracoccus liaowanqingii]